MFRSNTLARFPTLMAAAATLTLSTTALGSMFPPNNLYKEDGREASGGITKEQADKVIDQIERQYAPFAEHFDSELVIVNEWNERDVNAFAGRADNQWEIHLFGGLARRKEMTADAFTIVACHEAGHLFGGYPFYRGEDLSTEGQADYFATHNCARDLWLKDAEENALSAESVNAHAKKSCDSAWKKENDKHLCYRIANASRALGNLMERLTGETIDFATPDTQVVQRTIDNDYPSTQCRLDTYLTAALCNKVSIGIKIPGFLGLGNALNTFEGEGLALKESCSQKLNEVGYRPNCWFASLDR